MANVGAVITSIRNIMRQDRGISGDAQRLEQLGWMLFLKIIDDKDQELEIIKDTYESVIPSKFQWRNWATDTEGITGDELLDFIDRTTQNDKGLFATLSSLTNPKNPKRASIVQQIFDGTNNFMKSGYEMRKVINELNKVDFNSSKDKQVFGTIYESILVELRDAGNKGEYYTPRAVTRLMTEMTDPKLGEKVLDPASGTAGFLTEAIDHVRDKYVKTVDDEHILQKSITGWEFKPVPFVLGLTNLILHEIDIPDYHYVDSLKKEYNSIGRKDQVDVILANPPFGASIADGVETNFPATYRCKESADLFLILILKLLKAKGRCAIVLPDSCITGEGVKSRIREKLLTDTNLHTIVRLPDTTFHPATVPTNLLFFEKGSPTRDIWYYEHKLPENQKSYSKTKQIKFEEFEQLQKWWNNRGENEFAWKVNISDLEDWNLDIKNPIIKKENLGNSKEHFGSYNSANDNFNKILKQISKELSLSNHNTINNVLKNHSYLFKNEKFIEILKELILEEAFSGKLTEKWRSQFKSNESASALISRINFKKDELVKSKQLKKQKRDTAILENQKLFPIPDNWEWSKIGIIAQHNAGKTLHKGKNTGDYKDYITTSNLYWGEFQLDTLKQIPLEDKDLKKCTATKGDLLICEGGDVGRSAIWDKSYDICFQNHIHRVRPFCDMNNEYIFYFMMYIHKNDLIKQYKKGMGIGNLSGTALSSIVLPIAPIKEQLKIVENVKQLMDKCSLLLLESKKCEKHAQLLMKAGLKEAFESEDNKKVELIKLPKKPTNIDYYKRTLLATEIVWKLHKEPTLGHLKLQKLIYLAQESSTMQLPTNFLQQVAGPYDPQMARSLDKQMKTKKWFEYKKTELLKFKPLEKAGEHKTDFEKFFANEKESIQYIIDTFKTAKSDSIELVGTLYACWKKLIAEKQIVTDELISKRFYEWSEEKAKFEKSRILKALRWMETKGIVPEKANT